MSEKPEVLKPQVLFVSWKGFRVQSPYKYRRTIEPLYWKYNDKLIGKIATRIFSQSLIENYDEDVVGLPMTRLEKSLFMVDPIDNKIRTFLAKITKSKTEIVITVCSFQYRYAITYIFEESSEGWDLKKIILRRKRFYDDKTFKVIYQIDEEAHYSVLGLILISLLKKMFDTVLMLVNATEYLLRTNREYIWIEDKQIKVQIPIDDC